MTGIPLRRERGGLARNLRAPLWRHTLGSRRAAPLAHGGCGRINATLFGRALAVLDLAGQDMDHELGELVCVARAFLAFRSGRHISTSPQFSQRAKADPFVRLHRIDENASGEVAPLLAYLRELQRRHAIAVIVVHHAKKGAGHVRAGQALRGSSEFHAWGNSNLYLRRNRDLRESGDITLTVEDRAAPAMPSVTLELAQRANALALEVIEPRTPQTPTPSSVDERITAALTDVNRPLPFAELRARCRVRTATLYEPPRQVRPRLSPRRSLTAHARQSSREHSHNRQHDIAPAARFRFQLSLQRGGSGSGKPIKICLRSAACPARPTARHRPTAAAAPSFCSIGAILPSRPARATCRRAQRRSRMARLRATAPAARSVLDGHEHDGRLDRVGAAISLSNKQTIKRRPRKTTKKRTDA